MAGKLPGGPPDELGLPPAAALSGVLMRGSKPADNRATGGSCVMPEEIFGWQEVNINEVWAEQNGLLG
jgi:hypothetical protein